MKENVPISHRFQQKLNVIFEAVGAKASIAKQKCEALGVPNIGIWEMMNPGAAHQFMLFYNA